MEVLHEEEEEHEMSLKMLEKARKWTSGVDHARERVLSPSTHLGHGNGTIYHKLRKTFIEFTLTPYNKKHQAVVMTITFPINPSTVSQRLFVCLQYLI